MINMKLFEEEMKKRNISKIEMSNSLDMSRTAFYRKCNGISEFTLGEIKKISQILGQDSAINIFFTDKVS